MDGSTFALAPMTTAVRVVTYFLFSMPAGFAYGVATTVGLGRIVATGLLLFLPLVFASVWFWWRPTSFEVGNRSLTIVWPLRSRGIDLTSMKSAEIVDSRDFKQRYGHGVRVGAGGLWGSFGRLVCSNETFSMYVSRTDRFVLLRPSVGRALLITPEDPEAFVEAVRHAAR